MSFKWLNIVAALGLLVAGVVAMPPSADSQSGCRSVKLVYAGGYGDSGAGVGLGQSLMNDIQVDALGPFVDSGGSVGQVLILNHDPSATPDYLSLENAAGTDPALVTYNQEVSDGVTELRNVLENPLCDDERFVVIGHSQGAEVVGATLSELNTTGGQAALGRVASVLLFGDPKLFAPPTCLGGGDEAAAEWLRGSGAGACPDLDGILGGRNPYVPPILGSRTASWCGLTDPVCVRSGSTAIASHDTGYDGAGVRAEAEFDAAIGLSAWLPNGDGVLVRVDVPRAGADADVVFVFDTTGSMGSELAAVGADSVKEQVKELANELVNNPFRDNRVALVEFRDHQIADLPSGPPSGFAARKLVDFTDSVASFDTAVGGPATGLQTLPGIGGDEPEALLNALMVAFGDWQNGTCNAQGIAVPAAGTSVPAGYEGLSWRCGAAKRAIVITDQPFHVDDFGSSDLAFGRRYALDDIVLRSYDLDPVNVTPVVAENVESAFTELAESTAAATATWDPDGVGTPLAEAVEEAVTEAFSSPVVDLEHDRYLGTVGDSFVFRANAADPDGDAIVRYEWDFNADGVIDQTNDYPTGNSTDTVEFTYTEPFLGGAIPFTGEVVLRVTSSRDEMASGSAIVDVIEDAAEFALPAAPLNARVVPAPDSPDDYLVSWENAEPGSGNSFEVVDERGTLLGRTTGDSVVISGLRPETLSLTLYAVNEFGRSAPVIIAFHTCNEKRVTILGTEGDDEIMGTEEADVIVALGGNDRIDSLGGDDTICGDAGNDVIKAGLGDDHVEGGPNSDRVFGGGGDDHIIGLSGNDYLNGQGGDDYVHGGGSDDTIIGGGGKDTLMGFAGNDVIFGGNGGDLLDGGADDDKLDGGRGNDIIRDANGDDMLNGGPDNDRLSDRMGSNLHDGGAGNDLCVTAAGDAVVNCER